MHILMLDRKYIIVQLELPDKIQYVQLHLNFRQIENDFFKYVCPKYCIMLILWYCSMYFEIQV